MDENDTLMNTDDLAEILPLTKESIISILKQSGIPLFINRRRYYVLRTDFFAWLKTLQVKKNDETL